MTQLKVGTGSTGWDIQLFNPFPLYYITLIVSNFNFIDLQLLSKTYSQQAILTDNFVDSVVNLNVMRFVLEFMSMSNAKKNDEKRIFET